MTVIAFGSSAFKVIKVTRTMGTGDIGEYYSRGIGPVKRVAGDGITWELIS